MIEGEDATLKKLLAKVMLDNAMVKDLASPALKSPAQNRAFKPGDIAVRQSADVTRRYRDPPLDHDLGINSTPLTSLYTLCSASVILPLRSLENTGAQAGPANGSNSSDAEYRMNAKRSPSWDDLKILLELSRHSTIHAASKKLNIDHTTVCRRLARIETVLGLKLVDRSKAGLVVRPEAVELLRHIQYMEWHAHALSQGANTSNDGLKLVRIATMEGLASGYIAQRILLLKKSYPAIKVELVSTPTMVDVSKREADIFISFFEPRHRGLRCQKVGEVTLYLYASSVYERRNGLPKSEDELRDHDYVGYIDDLLAIDAVRWLKDLVPSPRVVFHSNSVFAQRGAAISGMGIAMLPTFVAADSKGLKPVRPDRFFVRRGVWMSVAGDPDYTSPIRAVAKFLVRIFEEDKALLVTP